MKLNFLKNRSDLAVLTYHSVSDGATPISVGSEAFEEQMNYLKESGANVISVADYLDIIEGRKKILGKNILITFDDGYRDIYLNALPVLKKYDFPAVMFINSAYVGKKADFATRERDKQRELCSLPELQELAESGVSIANHSHSHRRMSGIGEEEIVSEYEKCKIWIKSNIKGNVYPDVLALPKGIGDEKVKSALKSVGVRSILENRLDVYPDKPLAYFKLSLNPVFRWSRKNRSILIAVSSLVLLKIILGILLFSNIPDVGLPANYYLSSGGDDGSYVKVAHALFQGKLFSFMDSVGYPLFVALVMFITGLNKFPDLAFPLVFSNVFIFSTLAMIFSMFIVRHFWKNIKYMIFAGSAFMAVPYVWWVIFKDFVLVQIKDPSIVDPFGWTKAMHLFGLMSLTDWFSLAVVSLGFLLFLKNRYAWSGLLIGFSFLIRVQNMFLLFFLALGLILLRKYGNFIKFAVPAGLVSVFQLIQNYALTGSIFKFAAYAGENNINTAEHPVGFRNVIESVPRLMHYVPMAVPFLIIFIILVFLALKYFWHKKEALYFLVATGVISPFMLLFTNPAIRNPRYFLPFIPIFIVFLITNYEIFFLKKKSYNS